MPKKKTIVVEGSEYPVIERLGYQISADVYAVEVKTEDGERMAVSASSRGPWRWWRARLIFGPAPCGQKVDR